MRTHRVKFFRPASGWTLIELITVLIIVGILSVFALPRWFDQGAFEERGYFDQVLQATRYAQKLAVASHCEARIVITAAGFSLQQPAAPAQCGAPVAWQTVALPSGDTFQADPGDDIAATAATITFSASGRADNDYAIAVGPNHSFAVRAATGFVERL